MSSRARWSGFSLKWTSIAPPDDRRIVDEPGDILFAEIVVGMGRFEVLQPLLVNLDVDHARTDAFTQQIFFR